MLEKKAFKDSIIFKIIAVALLVLVLMIPAQRITSLVRERRFRKEEVIRDISEKWGREQMIGGPVLIIPYEEVYEENDETKIKTGYAYFLPQKLHIKSHLQPEIRYRSIYKTVVYNSNIIIYGEFNELTFNKIDLDRKKLKLDNAYLSLGITDMVGIKEKINIKWNNEEFFADPGSRGNELFNTGVHHQVSLDTSGSYIFSVNLNLNGSRSLKFLPLGESTEVEMTSNWENPSFQGNFLPEEREISDDGFQARWKVLNLNRNYPQQWIGGSRNYHSSIINSAFGVNFIIPLDLYQQVNRSIKYAVMFIFLTFLIFFFTEVLSSYNIHPIQYLLVGFALVIFYLLLLSLSEHIYFWYAYLAAGISTVSLIAVYTASILNNKRAGFLMAGVLSILYVFLYILLENQDFALLIGSIGVFIILAVVMYISRDIDWYEVNLKQKGE